MTTREKMVETKEGFWMGALKTMVFCHDRGAVSLPCPSPQPWNDHSLTTVWAAPSAPYVVPAWQWQSSPSYKSIDGKMVFQGMRVSVTVRDATMGGKYAMRLVAVDPAWLTTNDNESNLSAPRALSVAMTELMTEFDAFMTQCKHTKSRHVANIGRCCNRYECVACGHKFVIDSSD